MKDGNHTSALSTRCTVGKIHLYRAAMLLIPTDMFDMFKYTRADLSLVCPG